MVADKTLGSFRSPVRKLARFFRDSRDRWKEKCQLAKRELKRLANQIRAVEKSRDHWKCRFQEQQKQVRELQRELGQTKNGNGEAAA